MNKVRRKEIKRAVDLLDEAIGILTECRDEEYEAFESLPEGIQNSERGEQMQEYENTISEKVDELEYAVSDLNEIVDS